MPGKVVQMLFFTRGTAGFSKVRTPSLLKAMSAKESQVQFGLCRQKLCSHEGNSRISCWCFRAPAAGRWRVVSLSQQAREVFWKMGFPCSWCLTASLGAQLLLPSSWPNPDSVKEREVSFTEVKHIYGV